MPKKRGRPKGKAAAEKKRKLDSHDEESDDGDDNDDGSRPDSPDKGPVSKAPDEHEAAMNVDAGEEIAEPAVAEPMGELESEAVECAAEPGASDAPMSDPQEPAFVDEESKHVELPVAFEDHERQRRAHVEVGPREPRTMSTPAEIMALITPCSKFAITINKQDHRFRVQTKMKSDRFIPPYSGAWFSRSFKSSCWKVALKEIHEHLWDKWSLVRDLVPCEIAEQRPGEVPEDVLKAMAPVIEALPGPVKYPK